MKKLFLFLTVAAAALASCTKEYLVENTDAPKSNIIFQFFPEMVQDTKIFCLSLKMEKL